MPIIVLPRLLLSLLSWLILGAAAYLLWSAWNGYDVIDAHGLIHHRHGPMWRVYAGGGLLGWSLVGRFIVLAFMKGDRSAPREERGERMAVIAPDGSTLNVERFGLAEGPTLILTHGWGLNATTWWYTKRALGDRFRLIVWDLPGLGRSQAPKGGRFSIDGFAESLGAVIEAAAGDGPVVLVGHSIGGMTTQTFFRAAPPSARRRVAGVVLVDTTYENPARTMWLSALWRALQKPLIEPIMHLTVLLSGLAWLSAWQGYLSGMNHLAIRLTGFGRYATRGQVELTTRLAAKGSPGVQAKGNLAMLHWSAAEVLPTVTPPTLVLAGDKDIVTLPEASRTIAASIPNARLVEVEGCGHMGFMERADVYNREIAAFATEVLGAA